MGKQMKENKLSRKKIVELTLRFMARAVLRKYKPRVVAITGSVGKTSAKEAIFSVLAGSFHARKSEKNYNNEIGVPLTILGVASGEMSLFGWFLVFAKWLGIMLFSVRYPEVLVLEMAADRPGDLAYLSEFVHPEISVITEISASHLEYFKTLEGVLKEKATLVKALDEKGLAVINIDNPYLAKLKNKMKTNVLGFGFSEEAQVRATDVFLNDREMAGLSFKLSYKGATMPMRLNNALAKENVYAALSGIAVGIGMGMNLVEIGTNLENFSLPPGRLNLISGIKNSWIIDDTYNASFKSCEAAFSLLSQLGQERRKIVVLGDMLELGTQTEEAHRALAGKFLESKGAVFISVGTRMQLAVEELRKQNFSGEIYTFRDPQEAGKKLQSILRFGDLVLVKGSQGMRMEKVVEEIMAEPEKAEKLLCRQNKKWKNIPWKEV